MVKLRTCYQHNRYVTLLQNGDSVLGSEFIPHCLKPKIYFFSRKFLEFYLMLNLFIFSLKRLTRHLSRFLTKEQEKECLNRNDQQDRGPPSPALTGRLEGA